jgi:predicted TIM-barrel fold metal-dependent hydrolase
MYAMSWDKILFGSDWPLAPLTAYLDLVVRIVPEKYLEKVLGGNAFNIFTRIPNK